MSQYNKIFNNGLKWEIDKWLHGEFIQAQEENEESHEDSQKLLLCLQVESTYNLWMMKMVKKMLALISSNQ